MSLFMECNSSMRRSGRTRKAASSPRPLSPRESCGYLRPMPVEGYLERILRARVYDVAIETPLERAPLLSARVENQVLIKREDLQPVFSFKLRGAYNKISLLSEEEK